MLSLSPKGLGSIYENSLAKCIPLWQSRKKIRNTRTSHLQDCTLRVILRGRVEGWQFAEKAFHDVGMSKGERRGDNEGSKEG